MTKAVARKKAKTDLDGKLILGEESEEDDKMVIDTGDRDDEGGVGAYVNALKGRDAAQRGRGGKLKFSNKRGQDEDDEMEVDEPVLRPLPSPVNAITIRVDAPLESAAAAPVYQETIRLPSQSPAQTSNYAGFAANGQIS